MTFGDLSSLFEVSITVNLAFALLTGVKDYFIDRHTRTFTENLSRYQESIKGMEGAIEEKKKQNEEIINEEMAILKLEKDKETTTIDIIADLSLKVPIIVGKIRLVFLWCTFFLICGLCVVTYYSNIGVDDLNNIWAIILLYATPILLVAATIIPVLFAKMYIQSKVNNMAQEYNQDIKVLEKDYQQWQQTNNMIESLKKKQQEDKDTKAD